MAKIASSILAEPTIIISNTVALSTKELGWQKTPLFPSSPRGKARYFIISDNNMLLNA
jgi:hypothetical protein|tara:strand:+ start:968 stop:1141 length:174 start_codon:yes stop_codon:yes gene_type:complete